MKNTLSKILLLIALCSSFLSWPATAKVQLIDQVAAIVEKQAITQGDIQQRYKQLLQSNPKIPDNAEVRQQILERLIIESIQLQMAERSGVRISDERLNQTVASIARRNGMNLEQFQQALLKQGQSYAQAREQIRREMLLSQVQQGNLRNRIQISEQEVEHFLASTEGQKITANRFHIAHLLLPKGKSADDKEFLRQLQKDILQQPALFQQLLQKPEHKGRSLKAQDLGWRQDEELPSLFSNIAAQLQAGEVSAPVTSGAGLHLIKLIDKRGGHEQLQDQVQVRHILIKPSAVRDEQQSKKLLMEIRQRLLKGESFHDLARQYSDDPGSALQGGDLGWTPYGRMVTIFDQHMRKAAINEISPAFKSEFGWHVLQVQGRRQQDVSAERFKEQAYQAIYERKFNEELDAWLQKIRDEAFVEIKKPA